jgi:hypothetical protein
MRTAIRVTLATLITASLLLIFFEKYLNKNFIVFYLEEGPDTAGYLYESGVGTQ